MKRHNSQRGYFAGSLYQQMKKDKNVWLLVADLGYKIFDNHFADFPDRCINCGASEQAMIGMAVGLSLSGKKVFVYSITPFLVYRAFEWLRNYLDHENIAVNLVGSGRDKDYLVDGFSHHCEEIWKVLACLSNIEQFWPEDNEEIPDIVKNMIKNNKPSFLSLRR